MSMENVRALQLTCEHLHDENQKLRKVIEETLETAPEFAKQTYLHRLVEAIE